MQYWVVIERGKNNYSAYAPDVPGCIATGRTIEEIKEEFGKALKFHFEGLVEDGIPIPIPRYKPPIHWRMRKRINQYCHRDKIPYGKDCYVPVFA